MTLTDSEVACLKSLLRFWERFGYGSTTIVGLGCVGEFIAEFTRIPKTEASKHKLSRLSLIILILGIGGELLSAIRTSDVSGQLIANIEERAADAELRAGQANERASANEKEAAALRKEAAEIEESIAPRRLTAKQRELLASHLRKFAGRSLTVFADPSDAEAAVFASEIYLALKSAKWNVDGSRNVGRGGQKSMTVAPDLPATGIDVPCGPPKLHDAAGKALVRELSKMGFDSQCSKATGLWPLEVLSRPEGPQGDAKLRAEAKEPLNNRCH
ncbi:MAG: hypothetical protein ABSG11_20555 [Candidatus Korobacteraceae bacterium]